MMNSLLIQEVLSSPNANMYISHKYSGVADSAQQMLALERLAEHQ